LKPRRRATPRGCRSTGQVASAIAINLFSIDAGGTTGPAVIFIVTAASGIAGPSLLFLKTLRE
jgi:hypothetical protein